jgi:hypothetical protein
MKKEAYFPRSDVERLTGKIKEVQSDSKTRQTQIDTINDSQQEMEKDATSRSFKIQEKIGHYRSLQKHNEKSLEDVKSLQGPLKRPIVPKETVHAHDDEMQIVESVKSFVKLVFKE